MKIVSLIGWFGLVCSVAVGIILYLLKVSPEETIISALLLAIIFLLLDFLIASSKRDDKLEQISSTISNIIPEIIKDKLILFRPDVDMDFWDNFKGVYKGWNSTWDFETLKYKPRNILDIHKRRLLNTDVKEIQYVIFEPLTNNKTEGPNTDLNSFKDFILSLISTFPYLKKYLSKFKIFLIKSDERDSRRSITFFIGTRNGIKVLYLFLNVEPLMSKCRFHKIAFKSFDKDIIELFEDIYAKEIGPIAPKRVIYDESGNIEIK